jgi:hypothetical protein
LVCGGVAVGLAAANGVADRDRVDRYWRICIQLIAR